MWNMRKVCIFFMHLDHMLMETATEGQTLPFVHLTTMPFKILQAFECWLLSSSSVTMIIFAKGERDVFPSPNFYLFKVYYWMKRSNFFYSWWSTTAPELCLNSSAVVLLCHLVLRAVDVLQWVASNSTIKTEPWPLNNWLKSKLK